MYQLFKIAYYTEGEANSVEAVYDNKDDLVKYPHFSENFNEVIYAIIGLENVVRENLKTMRVSMNQTIDIERLRDLRSHLLREAENIGKSRKATQQELYNYIEEIRRKYSQSYVHQSVAEAQRVFKAYCDSVREQEEAIYKNGIGKISGTKIQEIKGNLQCYYETVSQTEMPIDRVSMNLYNELAEDLRELKVEESDIIELLKLPADEGIKTLEMLFILKGHEYQLEKELIEEELVVDEEENVLKIICAGEMYEIRREILSKKCLCYKNSVCIL